MLSYPFETFGKPLAQALRETPQPVGSEVLAERRQLRRVPQRPAHAGRLLRPRQRQQARPEPRHRAAARARPRDRRHRRRGRPRRRGVAVGDRRVVFPWIGCGACGPCAAGHEELCAAPRALGMQPRRRLRQPCAGAACALPVRLRPLPEDEACTYACSGLTAFSALKKARRLAPATRCSSSAPAGVGLSGVRLAAAAHGVAPVVAEIDRSKWDLAREAGAVDCLDPTRPRGDEGVHERQRRRGCGDRLRRRGGHRSRSASARCARAASWCAWACSAARRR